MLLELVWNPGCTAYEIVKATEALADDPLGRVRQTVETVLQESSSTAWWRMTNGTFTAEHVNTGRKADGNDAGRAEGLDKQLLHNMQLAHISELRTGSREGGRARAGLGKGVCLTRKQCVPELPGSAGRQGGEGIGRVWDGKLPKSARPV